MPLIHVNSPASTFTTGARNALAEDLPVIALESEKIRKHAGIAPGTRVPVYIVLREVEPVDWGVFGRTTRIEELRKPHPDEAPI